MAERTINFLARNLLAILDVKNANGKISRTQKSTLKAHKITLDDLSEQTIAERFGMPIMLLRRITSVELNNQQNKAGILHEEPRLKKTYVGVLHGAVPRDILQKVATRRHR